MEEAADDPSLDGSNKESAESNASTDAAMDGNGGGDNLSVDSKLALLQEIYQRKQAELLEFQQSSSGGQFSGNEYLQLLQNVVAAAALQQQQQNVTDSSSATPSTNRNQGNIPPPLPHPLLGQLRQGSSEQSTDTENMDVTGPPLSAGLAGPSTPSAFGGGSSGGLPLTSAIPRNRRTFSGSGQTISQFTRDRLKTMIATKKQRLYSSCSTGSSANIAGSGVGWLPPSNSELSFFGASGGVVVPSSLSSASNHFEPYPQFSHRTTTADGYGGAHAPHSAAPTAKPSVVAEPTELPSDYQLRKVNSEPNLKMRIRARLLNKGTSPQQSAHQSTTKPQTTAVNTPGLKRTGSEMSESSYMSDDTAARTALLLSALAQQHQHQQAAITAAAMVAAASKLQSSHAFGGNLIMPSPSLPNLLLMSNKGATIGGDIGTNDDATPVDAVSADFGSQQSLAASETSAAANMLMQMQVQLASYLSMPSLLRGGPFTTLSMFQQNAPETIDTTSSTGSLPTTESSTVGGGNSVGVRNNRVRFDTSRNTLPISGGYPSLLKQQLRDLVLRRKSLVREEPEEEQTMEVFSMAKRQQQQHVASSTGSPSVSGIAIPFSFSQLKTGLAYDQIMAKHQCMCGNNRNHVEHGGRVQSIWARLQEVGLVDGCERVAVRRAPTELLQLVHSLPYVQFFAVSPTRWLLRMESPQPMNLLPCGGIGVDLDTYFNFYDENVQNAICVAVGLLLELTCQVAEKKLRNGFACIRPPGHHAEREQAMGFCFCNNVAIATRYLQQRFGASCGSRIAIIDWDVHHGNGTQLCFESDPNVLYISLHRHDNGNFFPGTGAVTDVGIDAGRGFSVNIPFSGEMMGDAEYMAAWRVVVLPLIDAFRPEFILVSSGFDAARSHPNALGGYNLSPRIFGYFTRTLMPFAGGRVVMALEGGYDLTTISECAEECVRALRSPATKGASPILPPVEEMHKIPNQSAQETIQKVIAVHKRHWPCLTGVQGINTSELHWQTISQRFSSLTM